MSLLVPLCRGVPHNLSGLLHHFALVVFSLSSHAVYIHAVSLFNICSRASVSLIHSIRLFSCRFYFNWFHCRTMPLSTSAAALSLSLSRCMPISLTKLITVGIWISRQPFPLLSQYLLRSSYVLYLSPLSLLSLSLYLSTCRSLESAKWHLFICADECCIGRSQQTLWRESRKVVPTMHPLRDAGNYSSRTFVCSPANEWVRGRERAGCTVTQKKAKRWEREKQNTQIRGAGASASEVVMAAGADNVSYLLVDLNSFGHFAPHRGGTRERRSEKQWQCALKCNYVDPGDRTYLSVEMTFFSLLLLSTFIGKTFTHATHFLYTCLIRFGSTFYFSCSP